MRFLLTTILLFNLIFFLGCKTTTEDQSTVSSSPSQPVEKPQESEEEEGKPQSIVVPVSSLGDVSETRKQILQNTLEDELKEHFTLIFQERFEEAQEKAFEELDYEECTEDQCIMLIQEMLQVENVFHLQVIGEGDDTQLSLSWRTLDEKKKEEQFCENCGTSELRKIISGLVGDLIGIRKEIVFQKTPDGNEKTIKNEIKLIDNPNRGGGLCETVCEGLVGYYPFNGNANDMSGNDNHGEVFGAQQTYNHKGEKDSAYLFDGDMSYIKISNAISNSSFSLVAHVKIDRFVEVNLVPDSCSGKAGIVSNNSENGLYLSWCDEGWENLDWGKYYQIWYKAGGYTVADQKFDHNLRIQLKKYYLFAVTYDKETKLISLYKDKKLIQRVIRKTNPRGSYYIGIINPKKLKLNGSLNGVINEVRIYNRPLHRSEIASITETIN